MSKTTEVTDDHDVAGRHNDGDDEFMFLGITKFVQGPKKDIASFVWLKRNHHVEDILRNVAGVPFSTQKFSLRWRISSGN